MNRQEQISSLICLLFGLFIIMGSISSLKIGTLKDPGPGLFPLIAGIILSLFSVAILLSATFSKAGERRKISELWSGQNWMKTCYLIAALLVYSLMLELIGYLITTILLLIFMFKVLGGQNWKLAGAISIIVSAISYLLFGRILLVQFPEGFWGF